jgi:hypothetical protein
MKPVVIYLPEADEHGIVRITKEAIRGLIDQAYMQGKADASVLSQTQPSSPYYGQPPLITCKSE